MLIMYHTHTGLDTWESMSCVTDQRFKGLVSGGCGQGWVIWALGMSLWRSGVVYAYIILLLISRPFMNCAMLFKDLMQTSQA